MKLFTTLNNGRAEQKLAALTECTLVGKIEDADGVLLVAYSRRSKVGSPEAHVWLPTAVSLGKPVVIVAGRGRYAEEFAELARKYEIPADQVWVGDMVRIEEVAAKLVTLIVGEDYTFDLGAEDGGHAEAPALRCEETEKPVERARMHPEQPQPEAAADPAGCEPRADRPSPGAPPSTGCVRHLDKARVVVGIMGAKGGTGTTTVTACLQSVLRDHGARHLELGAVPSGYVYYGKDLREARQGAYVMPDDVPRDCDVLLVDIGTATPEGDAEAVLERASCVVLVADNSVLSFNAVKSWLEAGLRPHIIVVNRSMLGTGVAPEAYQGEFGALVQVVESLPGGLDEETAIIRAQRGGRAPLEGSVDLAVKAGDIAAAIRRVAGF